MYSTRLGESRSFQPKVDSPDRVSPVLKWIHLLTYNTLRHGDHVVVLSYPWFNFYFPLFWGMVMCDNEFRTKENKN